VRLASLALTAALLSACGGGSKHDLLDRAEGAKTRAELEAALGAPDERSKMGPIETWTYHGSDGDVSFLITGDAVALSSTREEDN
jgi:hypothetical protein